jgi:hypothetical protein
MTIAQHTRSGAAVAPRRSIFATIGCVLRPVGWSTSLVVAHVLLVSAGRVVPSPPLAPRAFLADIATTDPALTAFGLLRLLALAVTWYLAAVTLLAVVARLTRCRPLAVLAERIAVPALRLALQRVVGAGLVLSVAGGVAPLATIPAASASPRHRATITALIPEAPATPDAPSSSSQATMHLLPDEPTEAAPSTPPGTVRMRLVPDDADPSLPAPPAADPPVAPSPTSTTITTTAPPATPSSGPNEPKTGPTPATNATPPDPSSSPAPPGDASVPTEGTGTDPTVAAAPASSPAARAGTWTIAPGDHLWHVATATLVSRWERPPSNLEIATYVHRLIEANRDVLVVRDNPDLVFPGQIFALPEVPAA